MKNLLCTWILAILCSHLAVSQFVERFDFVATPSLPPGWSSTTNRLPSGDFVTTLSSPRSSPNVVLSSNATVSQTLTSASMNFSGTTPVRLEFYSSRSSSHTAGLLVEASLDNGATFPLALTDTLRNPGTSNYLLTSLPLPASLANHQQVRIRWRLVAAPTGGQTGTFRLDDVSIIVVPSNDLALTRLQPMSNISLSPSGQDQKVILGATVKNVGTQVAAGYSVHFFRGQNVDGRIEPLDEFAVVQGPNLLASDSTIVTTYSSPLIAGENLFVATVSFSADSNPSNDSASVDVPLGAGAQTIVVNEIMFDPLPGQNEWVEFYHRGQDPIDLSRWRFSDRPTSSGSSSFIITPILTLIQPRDYIVVAADSSVFAQFPHLATANQSVHCFILNRPSGFGLNNDGDDVILRDGLGRTIDSVSYSPSWHHPDVSDTKGLSLERINPDVSSNDRRNWSTSPSHAGGTPGRSNAIYTTSLPSAASFSINPNPFSPDGDGFEDFCIIRYSLPLTTSVIRISIFDIKGRLIRLLANTELSGPRGEIIWDGLDDTQQRVRIGPYIVFIEAIDGQAGILATAKAVVVVATKL